MTNNTPDPTCGARRFFAYHRKAMGELGATPTDLLRDQIEQCGAFVGRIGGVIVGRAVDIGSGLQMRNLPGYRRLLYAVTAHEIDAIVAADVSRLGRDWAERMRLFDTCRENKIGIWDAHLGLLTEHDLLLHSLVDCVWLKPRFKRCYDPLTGRRLSR